MVQKLKERALKCEQMMHGPIGIRLYPISNLDLTAGLVREIGGGSQFVNQSFIYEIRQNGVAGGPDLVETHMFVHIVIVLRTKSEVGRGSAGDADCERRPTQEAQSSRLANTYD